MGLLALTLTCNVSGVVTTQLFHGDLIGDVTGNLTGNVTGDVTGVSTAQQSQTQHQVDPASDKSSLLVVVTQNNVER